MKPIALITGSTSGIGEACARILADKYFLILCGRREDRLEKLANELRVRTDIHTLSFDVRNRMDTLNAIGNLPRSWQYVDVLINNAGNAHGLDTIEDGDVDDWDAMIDINVKGLLYVSKAIIPLMVERKSGHIINIGSLAGVDVYPKGNVYNASKFAVDALTKGMRMDLNPHGIKVSEVKPGLVETEFSEVRFKGDKEKAKQVYNGFTPLYAEDIAEVIRFVVTRPSHVNVADMLVLPTAQASSKIINKSTSSDG